MNDTIKPLPSLKAMAEKKLDGIGKQTIYKIDPRLVKVRPGHNGRIRNAGLRAHIDTMKVSMRTAGTAAFPPIDVEVEDGEIWLVDGECRTTAAVELMDEGHDQLYLEARQWRGSEDERTAHMLTSNQGRRFNGLELGHIYLRLRRMGWSIQKICARNGMSDTHVHQMIMLAESPLELQKLLEDERVGTDAAVAAIQKYGMKRALELLRGMVEQNGGKKKITKTAVLGRPFSRATVNDVVGSLDTFYNRLSEQQRSELSTLLENNEAELGDKTITLPAACLKGLIDARHKVEAERQKHMKKDAKANKKATAGATPVDDESFEIADLCKG
ncbi:hypothetical protein [Cupriavidus nantongensis]|uniref:ParB/Sulfiredoxin domain-containing protein n=1 Tax=Cupriavidus nantongensis TaxID=1796606 RepID=A0A142JKC8_9BURK|nr:hypothetical protein [Cupriavidus nantongensis]AMR78540.1 hypothetical protein A2G96_12765 [Cupriavidus nantongensis]